jgi:hypothetical protein
MGAKPKNVGGGANVGTADAWNQFLQQQLMGGGQQNPAVQAGMAQGASNAQQPGQQQQAAQAGIDGAMQAGGMTAFNGPQIPGLQGGGGNGGMYFGGNQQFNSQTGGGGSTFGNAFQNMMNGNVNDISGANNALQNYFNNPNANNLPTNFQNQWNSPNFIGAQTSQLPTNFGQGQTGMADLSQFGNAAQSNFNTQQGFGAQGTSQFTGAFQSALAGMQNGAPGVSASTANIAGPQSLGARPELAQGMDYGAAYNTLGQDPLMERNRMKAVADMRARFGAEGAGALGTGAQFAEGNLNAELAAQDASQRRAQAMQLMGQDLNERSTGANVALQGRGQDANYQLGNRNTDAGLAQTNAQLGTQASMANASNALSNNANIMQSILGARGQDFSNQLGNRNADISQLGLGAQQSMFNAGQSNDMQTAMMNAFLQNQGLGNNFALGGAQLNNNAMQTNNANNINTSQFQNNFNQNNAQGQAQYGQANNALNSQNMGQNNNFLAQMIGQGLNLNQLGNGNTMQMLQNLFGSFQQANGIGSPQAQTVMQPSAWGQIANAGLGLAGGFLGGGGSLGGLGSALGGLFGRGNNGGSAQLPIGIGGQGALPGSMGNWGLGNPNLPVLR